jgi:hypothetical protein
MPGMAHGSGAEEAMRRAQRFFAEQLRGEEAWLRAGRPGRWSKRPRGRDWLQRSLNDTRISPTKSTSLSPSAPRGSRAASSACGGTGSPCQ